MRKYSQLLSMFITRYLTYRARVLIWLLADSVQYILFPFLWIAIFTSTQPPAGYTLQSLVTYYIIMAVVSVGYLSHCSRHVRTEIHSGMVARRLSVPFPYFQTILMAEFSYKIMSTVIAIITISLLYIFGHDYLTLPSSIWQWLAFVTSLAFTFLLSHLIEFMIGLTSIWLGDIKSLNTLEEIANAIFSGRLAPLAFLPFGFQVLADYLPFKYLAFVPAQIFVGQITISQIPQTFGLGFVWIAILGLATWFMWKKGLRTYDGANM